MEKLKWIEELEDGSYIIYGEDFRGESTEEILAKVSKTIAEEATRTQLERL